MAYEVKAGQKNVRDKKSRPLQSLGDSGLKCHFFEAKCLNFSDIFSSAVINLSIFVLFIQRLTYMYIFGV